MRLRKKITGTPSAPASSSTAPPGTSSSSSWTTPGPHRGLRLHHGGGPAGRWSGDKTAKAAKVGELVAERAKAAGIDAAVFDRGGNRYHGRVAAIAEGAREGGLAL